MIANLEAMLKAGNDSASLRFALATKLFESGAIERALIHAEVAVQADPDYSAAWRLLGRIQSDAGATEAAVETFKRGIAVAERRGDRQVAKEMQVFLKRLERGL
jgi:Tfp pilus assembly protein PilF